MTTYANVFGGKFPVCNEKQKAELEEAYTKVLELDASTVGGIKNDTECMCDMIIKLLNGEGDRKLQIAAAIFIARIIYMEKQMVTELVERVQDFVMSQPPSPKETVH